MKMNKLSENPNGFNEVENSGKEKKKKDKKNKDLNGPSGKPNLYQQYCQLETKGNLSNSLIKSGAEALAGGALAPYFSAALGTKAPLLGLALIFAGNYLNDQSGLLKTAGAGVLAHSVAKAKEYRAEPEKTFKDRISGVTDDLLHMMMIRRYEPTESSEISPPPIPQKAPEAPKNNPIKNPVRVPKADRTEETSSENLMTSFDEDLKGWNDFLKLDNQSYSDQEINGNDDQGNVDPQFY